MRIARLATPIISTVVGKGRSTRSRVPAQRSDGPPHHRTPQPDPAHPAEPLVFIELSGPLIADTAPALTDVVTHRVFTPPPTVAAVLDLCNITTVDDDGRTALIGLRHKLEARQVELHLTATDNVLDDLNDVNALAPTLHPAVRGAILAAYEAVPGPAVVTSSVRHIFDQPFEPIALVPGNLDAA